MWLSRGGRVCVEAEPIRLNSRGESHCSRELMGSKSVASLLDEDPEPTSIKAGAADSYFFTTTIQGFS
jgi:hypothetical protein